MNEPINQERSLYEVTGDIKDINTVLIDRQRMERALASESVSIPNGLSPEQVTRFIATSGSVNTLQSRTPDRFAARVPSTKVEFDAFAGYEVVRTKQTPYGEAAVYRAKDDGPWRASKWSGDRWAVCSDQFAPHDVCLVIDGDFASDVDLRDYAEMLAAKLNSTRGAA